MRHHYIPEFLIKQWSTKRNDNKVEVFRLDLKELTSNRHAPKFTGYEDNLYSLSNSEIAGMTKHAVEENFLSIVDSRAALIRRKLEESGFKGLSASERADWVVFVTSLRLRQPTPVSKLLSDSADHLHKTLNSQPEEYHDASQEHDPPTLVEWAEKNFPGLIENCGLSFFKDLVIDPAICDRIFRMQWWLWNFSDAKHELLLADDPVILTTGIENPDLVIVLPISPKKAFLATQSEPVAGILRQQTSKHLAMRINESSLNQANIRLYATDTSPKRFIQNRLAKRRKTKSHSLNGLQLS